MTSRIDAFGAELDEFDKRFRDVEDDQREAVREHLPVDAVIKYSRGYSHCDATVIGHSRYGGDRVRVRGTSGKTYWIDIHRVVSIDWVPKDPASEGQET